MKKVSILVIALSACFFLGIITSLSFRSIRYTPLISPTIVDIDPRIAYQNIKKYPEKYILIDVRSEYEYSLAHASTSVSMPINTLYDGWSRLPRNKDKEIYIICSSGRLAGVAYDFLEHQGFRNIKRIEGGLQEWKTFGLPIIARGLFDVSDLNTKNKGLDIPFIIKND